MKKFILTSIVVFLILFTAFIKNSTKRLDDEIFVVKENLRTLKNELDDLNLEYTYLSSGKRLMDLKLEFFEEDLVFKKKDEIQFINKLEVNRSE